MEIAKNYYLDIVNEELDNMQVETVTEGLKVNNDLTADLCLDKIREEKAELTRFEMVINDKIRLLKERLDKEKESRQKSIDYYTGLLREYFNTLEINSTKAGNKIYKLPSGKIQLKKQQPEYIRDDEQLIKWLESNGKNEFIKIEKMPEWGELKKTVTVSNGVVLTSDGEVVDGVSVIERGEKFEVVI